ncbi:MAG: archaeal proteasome endopeptidase complex subunit beta [Candidatus Aenigmarchaeota archaeon]|nr:archaeal proteasome endopeptidase complex subunit beta [Candidatus Aenigmarchaeota archaeon]
MKQEIRETGTTTTGIICRDCVLIGSESKSTLGYLVSSKTAQKVYQIDNKIALTTAGGAGDTQAIVRMLKAEINIYKTMRHSEFTVNATVSLLSNMLQSSRYYPYMSMLIIGGHDKDGFHLWTIDPLGGAEKDNCVATGSGSPFAYGVLEADFKENMTKEEGIRLLVKAIRSARERDVFSGGGIVIGVITKDGFELVDQGKIEEILKTFNK